MRYLVALFLPPLAILSCGKPISSVFNLIFFALAWAFLFAVVGLFSIPFGFIAGFLIVPLGVAFWILAVVHAHLVVMDYTRERQGRELLETMERSGRGL